MSKQTIQGHASLIAAEGPDVGSLAAHALEIVARQRRARRQHTIVQRSADRLIESVMGRSDESFRSVVRSMLSTDIPPEAIIDNYVPAVAREMGRRWSDDTASFAEVSIGSARLQSLLRELGSLWAETTGERARPRRPCVLVLSPSSAQHTLGTWVLTSQLRRRGMSVRTWKGLPDDLILAELEEGQFSAVMVSASLADDETELECLIQTTQMSRCAATQKIVLGGSILPQDGTGRLPDGIACATSDVADALAFCGLNL